MLKGKKIVIGITGSIAAYKMPLLIRLLVKEEAEIQVIMTPSARDFVTPLTLATLSQRPVLIDGFDSDNGHWNSHVELGRWADVMLIAPASANSLAKMASGIADNFLLTVYLAAKCPVFIAPAMDLDMFHHKTTQSNIETLHSFGNKIIAPKEGELASGLCGAGRLEEPEEILLILKRFFEKKKS
jgi:phosphopantothenoylcysteine decarboxylase/phosphopantothenate--cysteine ligase